MVNTAHKCGVAKVAASFARVYSIGVSDFTLRVWWLNPTTRVWSLNHTLDGIGNAGNATAFHLSGNRKRVGIGRSNGDIFVLGRPDNNYLWASADNITGVYSTPINSLRFTDNGWHLLVAVSNSSVRLHTKADNWASSTPYNAYPGQSIDWDDANKVYTIGFYGNDNGNFTAERLTAANCENSTVNADPSRCNCNSPNVWLQGKCQLLSCTPAPFKNYNGFNSTNRNACACDTGYVWDESLILCKKDCNPAVTPNSNGNNYEFLSCGCNAGFQWNYATSACVRYRIRTIKRAMRLGTYLQLIVQGGQ